MSDPPNPGYWLYVVLPVQRTCLSTLSRAAGEEFLVNLGTVPYEDPEKLEEWVAVYAWPTAEDGFADLHPACQ